jgi:N-acetylmuramoyl-L-alanine amidase
MSTSGIIVCGKRYDVGHKVVTFDDDGGYSAYVPHRTDKIDQIYALDPAPGLSQRATRYRLRRFMGQSTRMRHLRGVVRQIVVHLDGCRDARMCYSVLHNQRGLSVHFMVDNDGTIYQCLDLLHCAYHAGGVNEISVGIELQNRGDAARYPSYYPGGRETVTCRIHGAQFLSYDFTGAQYTAMIRLCKVLSRIFDVPLTSPHENGQQVWTTISGVRNYRGFLGHYHLSKDKWDPGPWDFYRLFRNIGTRTTFPLGPIGRGGKAAVDLESESGRYFEMSEQDAKVHFPVGPLGRSKLWHGGVHLTGRQGTLVHAVHQGQIVAAQMGPPCAMGSCNFVLIRHRFSFGRRIQTFFSLYYHLDWATESAQGGEAIPWIKRSRNRRWWVQLERGEVTLLGVNVEAGEVIGTMGEAGPSGHREDQIHFATFSPEELTREVDPDSWEVIDGSAMGRLCKDRKLLSKIDRPLGGRAADGLLSRRELRNFFHLHPKRSELRRVVVRYLSEWTPGGWADELNRAPDFAALTPSHRRRLLQQQITPTLWWTPDVARHAALPSSGIIYAYHPIGFLVWFSRMIRQNQQARGAGIDNADRWEGKQAPRHLTVDAESGAGMTDEEDYHSGEKGKKLTLEDLVQGYPDDD